MHQTGSVPAAITVTQQVPSIVPTPRIVSTPSGTSKTLLPCHGWSGRFASGAFTVSSGRRIGRRRAAGDDAEHAAVAEHAAADVEDQLVQRGADGELDDARLLHVAVDAVEAHAAVLRCEWSARELAELLAAHGRTPWAPRRSSRGCSPWSGSRTRRRCAGKGGFMRGSPRVPSSELSIDVSSPQMYAPAPECTYDLDRVVLPEGRLAEIALGARLLDGALEARLREVQLVAHVDVRDVRADAVAGDDAALDARRAG